MGLFNWSKKKVSESVDYGKKMVGTEEIKNNASFIKEMASNLFSPRKILDNAKKETFDVAKNRLKVNDSDVISIYKNITYSFYISLFCALICLYIIGTNIFGAFSFMGIVSGFSIFLVCLAQCFRFSFRAFQIRHQKLCPVSDWVKRPEEWLPTF